MATVVQRPDNLNLLRNLKAYRIDSSSAVSFKLMKGDSVIIEETYFPDGTDIVTIDIQEVVAQYLSVNLPTSNVYSQTQAAASFSAYVDDSFVNTFKVVSGGVRKLSDTASNFLRSSWLTWQPQTKKVRWNQPEYLSYYHENAGTVKAKFYPKQGDPETVTIHSASAGDYKSYNMEMAHLFSMSSYDADELYGLVDVWVESSGNRDSWVQRYVFNPASRDEHYYMCVNSLGGIDTFCFTGARSLAPSINHEAAEQAEKKITITNDPERGWSQNTGYVGKTEAAWLWEFFASQKQWSVIDANVEEIILDTSSIKASDKANLNSSDFSFTLAEEGKLMKIARSNEEFPLIEIQSPAGELFFLAPRVVDYPDANLEDSLLFLVQSPYIQEWKKVSLGTIKTWIKEIFIPYEDLPLRLEILNDGDGFLAWGESLNLTCKVWKGLYSDVTNEVTAWSISRNSGVPLEDAAWLLKPKVRAFDGTIEICFNIEENDLGDTTTATGTIFTIRAVIEDMSASAEIEI